MNMNRIDSPFVPYLYSIIPLHFVLCTCLGTCISFMSEAGHSKVAPSKAGILLVFPPVCPMPRMSYGEYSVLHCWAKNGKKKGKKYENVIKVLEHDLVRSGYIVVGSRINYQCWPHTGINKFMQYTLPLCLPYGIKRDFQLTWDGKPF